MKFLSKLKPDFVVCGYESHFEDDIQTVCVVCENKIYHRPNVPDVKKICLKCMTKMIEDSKKK